MFVDEVRRPAGELLTRTTGQNKDFVTSSATPTSNVHIIDIPLLHNCSRSTSQGSDLSTSTTTSCTRTRMSSMRELQVLGAAVDENVDDGLDALFADVDAEAAAAGNKGADEHAVEQYAAAASFHAPQQLEAFSRLRAPGEELSEKILDEDHHDTKMLDVGDKLPDHDRPGGGATEKVVLEGADADADGPRPTDSGVAMDVDMVAAGPATDSVQGVVEQSIAGAASAQEGAPATATDGGTSATGTRSAAPAGPLSAPAGAAAPTSAAPNGGAGPAPDSKGTNASTGGGASSSSTDMYPKYIRRDDSGGETLRGELWLKTVVNAETGEQELAFPDWFAQLGNIQLEQTMRESDVARASSSFITYTNAVANQDAMEGDDFVPPPAATDAEDFDFEVRATLKVESAFAANHSSLPSFQTAQQPFSSTRTHPNYETLALADQRRRQLELYQRQQLILARYNYQVQQQQRQALAAQQAQQRIGTIHVNGVAYGAPYPYTTAAPGAASTAGPFGYSLPMPGAAKVGAGPGTTGTSSFVSSSSSAAVGAGATNKRPSGVGGINGAIGPDPKRTKTGGVQGGMLPGVAGGKPQQQVYNQQQLLAFQQAGAGGRGLPPAGVVPGSTFLPQPGSLFAPGYAPRQQQQHFAPQYPHLVTTGAPHLPQQSLIPLHMSHQQQLPAAGQLNVNILHNSSAASVNGPQQPAASSTAAGAGFLSTKAAKKKQGAKKVPPKGRKLPSSYLGTNLLPDAASSAASGVASSVASSQRRAGAGAGGYNKRGVGGTAGATGNKKDATAQLLAAGGGSAQSSSFFGNDIMAPSGDFAVALPPSLQPKMLKPEDLKMRYVLPGGAKRKSVADQNNNSIDGFEKQKGEKAEAMPGASTSSLGLALAAGDSREKDNNDDAVSLVSSVRSSVVASASGTGKSKRLKANGSVVSGTGNGDKEVFIVREAITDELRQACLDLHGSKATFSEATEKDWIHKRIFHGKELRCKTWGMFDSREVLRAAITCRVNECPGVTPQQQASFTAQQRANKWEMIKDPFRWLQIMNMSAATEGQGDGTRFVKLLEAHWKMTGYKMVVLYPADNESAPKFWGSLGFKERDSMLPDRAKKDGLIAEMDVHTRRVLPLWEKDINLRTIPRRAANMGASLFD